MKKIVSDITRMPYLLYEFFYINLHEATTIVKIYKFQMLKKMFSFRSRQNLFYYLYSVREEKTRLQ